MQSPQKLHQQVSDLLGPPGPDSDPLELMLRTVVQTTAPMMQGVVDQFTPDQLDQALEHAAYFFLRIRSDGAALTPEFLEHLGAIQQEAYAQSQTVPGTAAEATGELPAAPSGPAPDPAAPPAPDPAAPAPAQQQAPPPAPPWGG